jgi:NitT/TauT family transport system substrate-binding protein
LKIVAGAALLGTTIAACSSSGTDSPESQAGGSASECEPVSVALPTSTEGKLVTYAVEQGKVASDDVELDVHFLEVPALIQATGTDQFDLLQTSLVGFAGAVNGGAPLVAIAPVALRGPGQDKLVVAADSDIRSLSDLDGATVAVGSIGSTVTTLVRMGLAEASGLDASAQGGDMQFTEMAPAAALTGIQRGTVDAAFIYQQPWWGIQSDPEFRELADVQETFEDAYGFRPVISMLISTEAIASDKQDCLIAANDLLVESWEYAKANPDEVAEALTESENVAVEDLTRLIDSGYEYGGTQDAELLEAAQQTLEAAHEAGELAVPVPDLSEHYIKP